MGSQQMVGSSASVLLLLLCASLAVAAAAAQKYNALYNFGDSITDTGNLCANGKPSQITFTQPPYGETYFGNPTCRCCDGRVIVDFLCSKFGLPFLPPSKSSSADFKKGANMAITGATAMDADFFRSLGLSDKIWNNGPISFQIQWFQQIATSVCGKNCKNYLANSLFVFGEFGGNDYNAMLFGGYTADQASTYTPNIVNAISNGIEKLIALGAVDIVVPGVLPIGCFPIYLTIYGTSNSGDYNNLGCLKKFNDLSTYHNNMLQTKIANLQSYGMRRLLPGRLQHGPKPPELRFQHGVPDVLRGGRRQVQLRQQQAVRDAGRGGVRQPGGAPQLGRHPPHRGRVQADHRRLAQRALLPPGHPPQLGRHGQAVMGID